MSNQIFIEIQNSNHWDEQISYLQRIQIIQTNAKILNCPKNTAVIKNLLNNPRSKVLTITAQFLVQMFEKYGELLHTFALSLMGTDILFKLLNSSNKVIFANIHQLFKAIIIHSSQIKYYSILCSQMNHKNSQVRECISSYIVILANSIDFPNNLEYCVKNMMADSNKNVRSNANQLLEMTKRSNKRFEPKKIKKQIINKQNIPQKSIFAPKPNKINTFSQKFPQTSQLIIQSFINTDEQEIIDSSTTIQFLLTKLNASQTWNMRMFAIEQICALCLKESLEDKIYLKIVPVLVDLIDEKRSKLNVLAHGAINHLIDQNPELFNKYLGINFLHFVEKAVKFQENQTDLINKVIEIDPISYIVNLAQTTVDIKPYKQKVLLLDSLVEKICHFPLDFSKVSTIVKLICKHIQKYFTNKEVYLPCLAILSHFKVTYPQQFLGCLLSIQNQTLNKILSIAANIDPQLKEAIVNYIMSLKGKQKNNKKQKNFTQKYEQFQGSQLQKIMEMVLNEEENSMNILAEYIFELGDSISSKELLQIIKLIQKVTSQNSLLELQLLLEQISKCKYKSYVQALFQAISLCDTSTIETQYVISYLRKINSIFSNDPSFIEPKYAELLIITYRCAKCPKIRLLCIKILALFPLQIKQPYINSKEKDLIMTQQKIQAKFSQFSWLFPQQYPQY